jgi:hypothetical protein
MAASYRGSYTPGKIDIPTGGVFVKDGTTVIATGTEMNLLSATATADPTPGPWVASSRWAKTTYDFDVSGGAQGAIGLGVSLPDNALVLGAYLEKITAFTSGGASTVAISAEGANDIVTATAYNNAAFTADVNPAAAVNATPFKTTQAREITLTIASADLTAGKYHIWVEYLVGA